MTFCCRVVSSAWREGSPGRRMAAAAMISQADFMLGPPKVHEMIPEARVRGEKGEWKADYRPAAAGLETLTEVIFAGWICSPLSSFSSSAPLATDAAQRWHRTT